MNHHSGSASTFSVGTPQPEADPAAGLSPWQRAAGLMLAYLALAWAAVLLKDSSQLVMPLWPAAGLALAALAVWGWRYWPSISARRARRTWRRSVP